KEGGDISQLQVDQVEINLLRARSTVLTDIQQIEQPLDQFKLQLGLPIEIRLELDNAPLRPILRQYRRFEEVLNQFEAAQEAAGKLDAPAETVRLRNRLREYFTASPLVQGTKFSTEFPRRWAEWEKLMDPATLLRRYPAERRVLLDRKDEYEKKEQPFPAADQARLDEVEGQIDLGTFEIALRTYEGQPWNRIQDPERRGREQTALFRDVLNGFIV